jgi:hypothetical protein
MSKTSSRHSIDDDLGGGGIEKNCYPSQPNVAKTEVSEDLKKEAPGQRIKGSLYVKFYQDSWDLSRVDPSGHLSYQHKVVVQASVCF